MPQPGDTIIVYKTGTTDLVTGLKSPDSAGSPISNPFTVPASGLYGFEPPNFDRVDIYWTDDGSYVAQDVQVADAKAQGALREGFAHKVTEGQIIAGKIVFADIGRYDPISVDSFVAVYMGAILAPGSDFNLVLGSSIEFVFSGLGLASVIEADEYINFGYPFA